MIMLNVISFLITILIVETSETDSPRLKYLIILGWLLPISLAPVGPHPYFNVVNMEQVTQKMGASLKI